MKNKIDFNIRKKLSYSRCFFES